ncbi:hypothetical protein CRM22_011308 [Opisthorchis felineus]|uniref:RRM domain-containing protein n=1 Tax=Opisthorchis felineus TaxID=147828 RepID=A0A4S2JTM7_OPIFE|nr:hypothetical protein CRM22_011308 [Opisthorchis felineus]
MLERKLFVGGLNPVTDDYRLREFYSKFGVVTDAVVMKDIAGRSRGFGFVTYEDPQMAEVACNARPHEIDGKIVDAKKAVPKGDAHPIPDVPVRKIFIGGLRRSVKDSDLFSYFSEFGQIVEAVVMVDKETNQSRGFGFVTFVDTDSVDRVANETLHSICGFPVDVKKAVAKDDLNVRKKPFAARFGSDAGPRSATSNYPHWTANQGMTYGNAPPSYMPPPVAAPVGSYAAPPFWSQPPPVAMGFYPNQNYTGGPVRENSAAAAATAGARAAPHPYGR